MSDHLGMQAYEIRESKSYRNLLLIGNSTHRLDSSSLYTRSSLVAAVVVCDGMVHVTLTLRDEICVANISNPSFGVTNVLPLYEIIPAIAFVLLLTIISEMSYSLCGSARTIENQITRLLVA